MIDEVDRTDALVVARAGRSRATPVKTMLSWIPGAHGLQFRSEFWLAADATYYTGGRTSLDGVAGHDFQSGTRAGFTLSVPIGNGFSAKASFGGWLTAQNAATFDRIGLTLQYRWFDPETPLKLAQVHAVALPICDDHKLGQA